jgi:hypothetical protein
MQVESPPIRMKPSEKLKKLAEQTGSNSACSAYLDARSLAEAYEAEQEKKIAELVAELRRRESLAFDNRDPNDAYFRGEESAFAEAAELVAEKLGLRV